MSKLPNSLTKRLKSKDNVVLISVLSYLRDKLANKNPRYVLDSASFKLIVSLLKMPNRKILNYSTSIIANCCKHERYRRDFSETEGVVDLVAIIKNADYDSIACGAWRLVGNLSSSLDLCLMFLRNGIIIQMVSYLRQIEEYGVMTTQSMVFRAVGKVWSHKFARSILMVVSDGFSAELKDCLNSENPDTVLLTLKLFVAVLSTPSTESNAFPINRDFILQLVNLSKEESFTLLSTKCLAAIVTHHVVCYVLEGTGIAEVFLNHLKENAPVEPVILQALCNLCQEGAIRNKIKTANLFPALIKLCHGPNQSVLINLFLTFQYDQPSILTLAESEELLGVLVGSIASPYAVLLLTLIARLDHRVPALVMDHNLDVFISSAHCNLLLSTITKSKRYFKTLLVSGKVWALSGAGCPMEEVGSSGYGEGAVEHFLLTGVPSRKRVVALAVPFLVTSRNFKLLYTLLARHSAMDLILEALRETPTDDAVVAAIVRLAALFRDHPCASRGACQFFLLERPATYDLGCVKDSDSTPHREGVAVEPSSDTRVTFELDDGTTVTGPRRLLSSQSPVLDAMLNGHFVESGQDRVRVKDCSRAGLACLVRLVEGHLSLSSLDIDIHLELVSLTDRFLMPEHGNVLTNAVKVSGADCAHVYLWARRAGAAANAARLRARAYWELLSGAEQLLPALTKPESREPLIEDITEFLTGCVGDLLLLTHKRQPAAWYDSASDGILLPGTSSLASDGILLPGTYSLPRDGILLPGTYSLASDGISC